MTKAQKSETLKLVLGTYWEGASDKIFECDVERPTPSKILYDSSGNRFVCFMIKDTPESKKEYQKLAKSGELKSTRDLD